MKPWTIALCLLAVCASVHAQPTVWQPAAGHTQIPLWPATPPDAKPMPGPEYARTNEKSLIGGKPATAVSNVSQPTMTVYAPTGKNRNRGQSLRFPHVFMLEHPVGRAELAWVGVTVR